MKTMYWSQLSLFALAATILPLTSCVVAQKQPFNEADFAWTTRAGTGGIDGHAYIEMKDKTINVGSHATITLLPDNAYTREIITRKYQHGDNLAPADPRLKNYVTRVKADDDGNFVIRGLAPGNYFIASRVRWINHSWFPDNDNNLQADDSTHAQFIYSPLEVRNGYTTHVMDWNQGADWNLDTVLH